MLRLKTLIHLLVSLALILNGVGAAAASAVMATPITSAVESFVSKDESSHQGQALAMQSGCHEHHDSMKQQTTEPASSTKPTPDSDCCDDGACGCGCAYQSHVVLAAELLVMPAVTPASLPWEQRLAPLAPSLPIPVRPPIA